MTNEELIWYWNGEAIQGQNVIPDIAVSDPTITKGRIRVDKRLSVIRFENETEGEVTIVIERKDK